MDTLILRSLVLAVASLLCSSQLHASPLVINDRPTFAALGPQKIYTFEPPQGFPAAPAPLSSFDSIIVRSGPNPASVQQFPPRSTNQVLAGAPTAVDPLREPVTMEFPVSGDLQHGISAVGFDLLRLEPLAEVVFITISGFDLSPAVQFQVVDNDGDVSTPRFWGILWDTPIRSIEVHTDLVTCAAAVPCPAPTAIDNLTIVPEPGTPALMGVASLGSLLRRSRLRR